MFTPRLLGLINFRFFLCCCCLFLCLLLPARWPTKKRTYSGAGVPYVVSRLLSELEQRSRVGLSPSISVVSSNTHPSVGKSIAVITFVLLSFFFFKQKSKKFSINSTSGAVKFVCSCF